MTHFLTRYYRFILVLILAWSFLTRIYNLYLPENYVFDEVYHAVTAKLVARNDPQAYEWWNPPIEPNTAVDWLHPPIAKYTQALGILAFGENSFGWRISSVVFGVLVIAALFKVAELAFDSKPLALLAALIGSFDGLLLVQSRVAMNDIHLTFFILLTLIFYLTYLKKKHSGWWLLATGVSAGLAMGTKWSGLYILGLIGLWEGIRILKKWWHAYQQKTLHLSEVLFSLTKLVLTLILVPFFLYIAAYSHMFIQGKDWQHFSDLHYQIWWYQTNLEATHTYQSRPWQWFFNVRPVWYHVNYVNENRVGNIYAFGNPAVLWSGVLAVGVTLIYLISQLWKRKKISTSLLLIFTSYLIVWLPWELSPRIMFFYHYTPAIPLLAILIAYWLRILWHHHLDWLVYLSLGLMAVCFGVWYPHWTEISVSPIFANYVYFALTSWR